LDVFTRWRMAAARANYRVAAGLFDISNRARSNLLFRSPQHSETCR